MKKIPFAHKKNKTRARNTDIQQSPQFMPSESFSSPRLPGGAKYNNNINVFLPNLNAAHMMANTLYNSGKFQFNDKQP